MLTVTPAQPNSSRCYVSITSENIRKPQGFLMLSEGIETGTMGEHCGAWHLLMRAYAALNQDFIFNKPKVDIWDSKNINSNEFVESFMFKPNFLLCFSYFSV